MGIADYAESMLSGTRFSQFLSVGILGAIVDNATLVGLVEFATMDPLFGKIIAAEASIILMFAINEKWTFSEFGVSSGVQLLHRFLKSNAVRVGGVLVALCSLFVLHDILGVWYLAANIVGIGLGFFVNYAFESLFTWNVQTSNT